MNFFLKLKKWITWGARYKKLADKIFQRVLAKNDISLYCTDTGKKFYGPCLKIFDSITYDRKTGAIKTKKLRYYLKVYKGFNEYAKYDLYNINGNYIKEK